MERKSCKDRTLYRIHSRNLRMGVYRADLQGYIGLREKFGDVFPFTETSTARPLEELPEQLPDDILMLEHMPGTQCLSCGGFVTYDGQQRWEHTKPSTCEDARPATIPNTALNKWLHAMEAKYPCED